MPKLKQRVPKYRKHRASGQAVVTLSGRDYYLGPHGTRASRLEYDRLITEWLANGRCPPISDADILTVNEIAARFWRHAKRYYVKNGRPTSEQAEYRLSLRIACQLYGRNPVTEFTPPRFVVRPDQERGLVARHASALPDPCDSLFFEESQAPLHSASDLRFW